MAERPKPLNVIEIAKLAGSSKSAVSRVLHNQSGVAPEVRARIEHIIRVHHYRPSLFGRGLKGSRTGLIGVLGRFMESGFTAEVIRGIDDEVKKRGGHLLITFAPGIEEYIDFWRSLVAGRDVDGLILIAPPLDLFQHARETTDKPVAICAAAPPHDAVTWKRAAAVTLNNEAPMERLVKHLVVKGCRRLLYLAGQPDIFDSRERSRFFAAAVARHRGVTGTIVQGAWIADLAKSVVNEYLETHKTWPDAILTFNDAIALGVLEILQEKGVDVPGRIAVSGWDDIPFARYAGLTTVHHPMADMGGETARALFHLLHPRTEDEKPVRLVMDMSLEVRRSTARPPKK